MSAGNGVGPVSLLGLDPGSYESHALHGTDRDYPETNCYTDILIELLHARGEEPLAMMGSALAVDFEGDQWTFFKPRPEDLVRLYGIEIHEMQPYRPLPEQIAEQIARGQTIAVELDSWYLPDTASTSYRAEHVKSSIVAEAIDLEGEALRYFHGTGYFELGGEDYRGVFRLGRPFSDDVLPPYTELVRFDAGPPLRGEELLSVARELLGEALRARPRTNPFERFGAQLESDLPRLLEGDLDAYHDYAFATVRMVGSAFEAVGSHVTWLLGEDGRMARGAIDEVVAGCKALSFRLARRRPFDPVPAVTDLAAAWERTVAGVGDALA
jgi:Domain of unknown function (DUF1839)